MARLGSSSLCNIKGPVNVARGNCHGDPPPNRQKNLMTQGDRELASPRDKQLLLLGC